MKSSEREMSSIPVATFLEEGGRELEMELAGGKSGLKRRIVEAAINRPGLALSGFYEHFPHRRIQVLGLAECAYLASLGADERRARLGTLLDRKVPCVVVTRGRRPSPELLELAEARRVAILRSGMITKHYVNAATIIMENLMAPRTKVQGTMVEIMGIGVLIQGKPGMGKSEIALSLIKRGHALVADDITDLRLDSAGSIMGAPVDVTRYHMEIRGLGIIHVPSLFGVSSVRGEKKLEMVVCLREGSAAIADRSIGDEYWEIFGKKVPSVSIPVGPGRDLANVIETAALDQKLRTLGHDAEKELDAQLIARLIRGKNGSE